AHRGPAAPGPRRPDRARRTAREARARGRVEPLRGGPLVDPARRARRARHPGGPARRPDRDRRRPFPPRGRAMTTAVLPSSAVIPRPAPVNKWLVTASIAFGSLMAAIDASIVNVALPEIRGTVGATVEEITWVSTSYIIATVLVMPLTGFLGSFFGQKR